MANVQSYAKFVSSGMKGVDSGIRRIGPEVPGKPGRPGRPRPGFTPPKPKTKPIKPTTFKGGEKINEFLNVPNEEMNGARLNMKELSEYLNIEETDLCDIIYNGILANDEYSDNTEQINTLAYSYGLI